MKQVQIALNTCFNKGINSTPMKALMGYNPKHAAEAKILNAVQDEINKDNLKELRLKIAEHIAKDQEKQKERYDKIRREASNYDQDELVMIKITSIASTGSSHKLSAKYKGPFRITKKLFNDRYEVEDLIQGFKNRRTVVLVERGAY